MNEKTINNQYVEITFESWREFQEYVNDNFFGSQWIFRGQKQSEWDIKSSLERLKNLSNEMQIVEDFKTSSVPFMPMNIIPSSEDDIGWLSLMQHHGAPTRLVDFTTSPFIASYFAYETGGDDNDHVAVWAINHYELSRNIQEVIGLRDIPPEHMHLHPNSGTGILGKAYIEKINHELLTNKHNLIFTVHPRRINQRIFLQKSEFLCVGNIFSNFMKQLFSSITHKHIYKFVIPTGIQRTYALIQLNRFNINHATLFSDLDGYAKSLGVVYETDFHAISQLSTLNSTEEVIDAINDWNKYSKTQDIINKIENESIISENDINELFEALNENTKDLSNSIQIITSSLNSLGISMRSTTQKLTENNKTKDLKTRANQGLQIINDFSGNLITFNETVGSEQQVFVLKLKQVGEFYTKLIQETEDYNGDDKDFFITEMESFYKEINNNMNEATNLIEMISKWSSINKDFDLNKRETIIILKDLLKGMMDGLKIHDVALNLLSQN